ncbi:MmcQ/YjbR family DNA-binding protein [Pseudohoeflea coraliihabitans]|uniref:MmcQ/YjbR family DNA-binding protein n=1 Tax=Pseudohoeflea coraliihabitans TaxID=2860393 RepID=A0ABS6WKJ2_9HYPH|nr:MmcQ/YjbR family DNA-binding protein [Pseudohoeflea sp. DP4N28-3]MBW3096463.1 MmcQ/YjbR family DNA-binding protein [Pseudohoeflea sp. DP4N28-3]
MQLEEFDRLCAALPATHTVVQWGGAHVWKVGAKVFALAREGEGGACHVTFKASEMAWEIFRDAHGVRPAPYLATRGMKWLQWCDDRTIDEATLCDLIAESHALVTAKLTKKARSELGL